MTHDKPSLGPKIALYEPDIPQNTASIVRTCSCLGAQLESSIISSCAPRHEHVLTIEAVF